MLSIILKSKYSYPFIIMTICWIIQIINMSSGYSLTHSFGIVPRDFSGLWGILFSPILHGSVVHIISNTFGFIILSCVMLTILKNKDEYLELTLIMSVVTGLLVWIFATNGVHVGISGIIFSYFGFIVASSMYSFSIKNIALSLPVILFYGTMIFGVLPIRTGISWESHLFGLIVGFMIGKYYYISLKKENDK